MHLYYETGIQSSVISVNQSINHVETFEVFCPIKEKALSHWTCMKPRLQEETERSKEERHSLNNTVLFS